jgi:hypothetical protein
MCNFISSQEQLDDIQEGPSAQIMSYINSFYPRLEQMTLSTSIFSKSIWWMRKYFMNHLSNISSNFMRFTACLATGAL